VAIANRYPRHPVIERVPANVPRHYAPSLPTHNSASSVRPADLKPSSGVWTTALRYYRRMIMPQPVHQKPLARAGEDARLLTRTDSRRNNLRGRPETTLDDRCLPTITNCTETLSGIKPSCPPTGPLCLMSRAISLPSREIGPAKDVVSRARWTTVFSALSSAPI